MCTERIECSNSTLLCDALGGQLLRHATIIILEVVSKLSAIDISNTPISGSVTSNTEDIVSRNSDSECNEITTHSSEETIDIDTGCAAEKDHAQKSENSSHSGLVLRHMR